MSKTENNIPDKEENEPDMINPYHYVAGGIEAIDVIAAKLTKEQFIGFLLGNVLKYQMRFNYKNKPLEDSKKGNWYLEKLIKELEEYKCKEQMDKGIW